MQKRKVQERRVWERKVRERRNIGGNMEWPISLFYRIAKSVYVIHTAHEISQMQKVGVFVF